MLARVRSSRRILSVPRQLSTLPSEFGNFINGKFVPPVDGIYFDNLSPVDGKVFIKAARSGKKDIDIAVDAANEAFVGWSKVSVTDRSNMLLKIANVIESNLEMLARIETMDNGKGGVLYSLIKGDRL